MRLTEIGRNHLRLTGCFPGGGNQALSAEVQVLPHSASLHASEEEVNKGDRVHVSGAGFCRTTRVLVRVYDDGHRYITRSIKSNRHGTPRPRSS